MIDWNRANEEVLGQPIPPEVVDEQPSVNDVRIEFMDRIYPVIFGDEEMGDPSVEVEPQDLTGILVLYGIYLAKRGVIPDPETIETATHPSNYRPLGRLGRPGYLKVIPPQE